jgi:hypothetical protein
MTAPDGRTSQATITVVASNTLPECRDGIDNDVPVDGKVDFGGGVNNDPGCTYLDDPSEATPTQCSDGYDNDGDFKTDFPVPPGDRGCTSAADNDEYNPPECSDGINNDGDAGTDYGVGAHVPPYDLQCSSLADDSEASANAQLTLYPTAFTVRPRQTTVLNWSVVDVQANSCTLSGTNGDSWVLTGSSGTKTTAAITQATVYTLSCTDLGVQPVSQSTTVKILPTFNEF